MSSLRSQATPAGGQQRRFQFGLQLAPSSAPHAEQLERHWRIPVLMALALTIPAFYADLLREANNLWADAACLAAAAIVAAALEHTARRCPQPARHVRANLLEACSSPGCCCRP